MNIRYPSTSALLLLALLLFSPDALAQTVDGQFQTQINPGAGTGEADQLEVTLELAASPAFDLGSATLMFTYNSDALALASTPDVNERLTDGIDFAFQDPYISDPGTGKFYNTSTVTVFGQQGRLSANLVLGLTGFGQTLPADFTPVLKIFFDITDATQTAELAWITSGDANPTEVTLEDNLTLLELGDFTGDNGLLPVELTSFEAVVDGSAAVLSWQTVSETNNAGFELEQFGAVETRHGASLQWSVIDFVDGHGTTVEVQSYTYRVADLMAGVHRFRLKQVDYDGTSEYSPEVEVVVGVVGAFEMTEAYPNPFNPQTQFTLAVAQAQQVEIAVYNVLGRRVDVLFDGEMPVDQTRAFMWEAGDRPSGLYFIRAVGERFVETRRVTLLK